VPIDPYHEVLKCSVRFHGQKVALAYDAAAAARPVSSGNPELAAEADRLAGRYLEGLVTASTAARVRAFRRWMGPTPREYLS
jgi:hypothetical protein